MAISNFQGGKLALEPGEAAASVIFWKKVIYYLHFWFEDNFHTYFWSSWMVKLL